MVSNYFVKEYFWTFSPLKKQLQFESFCKLTLLQKIVLYRVLSRLASSGFLEINNKHKRKHKRFHRNAQQHAQLCN